MGEEKKAADQRDELQKQIDALTPPPAPTPTGSKGPEGALPEDKPPVTLTPEKEAEKKQLTQKRDDLKADHSVSQKQFESYYKNNSDKPEGWAAGLIVSKILIDQEKRDEARVLFEEIVAKAKGEPFYQIQGRFGLIGLYEEQGDFDKGLGEVDHLMGLLGAGKETSTTKQALYTGYVDELMPRLLLKKAQLQIFKGSKAEAAQTLAQLTEKHSNSPQAQEARQLKAVVQ